MTQLMLAAIFAGSVCTTGAYPGSEPYITAVSAHIDDVELLYEEAADQLGLLGAYRADPFKFYGDDVLANLDFGRAEQDHASSLCADLIREHRSQFKGIVEFAELQQGQIGNRYPPRLIVITHNHLAMVLMAR